MAVAEKSLASVISVSPFLNAEQVAAQLGCTPLEVRRLVARGSLRAVVAGEELKIRSDDLDEYARKGSPDFDSPEFDSATEWFDDGTNRGAAERFAESIGRVISDSFLQSIPRDGKGQIMSVVNVPVAGAIRQIVSGPALTSGITIAGQPSEESRFSLAREQYAGDQIRRILATLVRSGVSSVDALAGKTGLRRLYDSPEEYGRLTAAAIESFAGNAISLGKEYPDPTTAGVPRTIRVTYRVRHADLGLDMSHVVRQAL